MSYDKKLFLFDLDGTLLNSEKLIPDGALNVLREYKEAGKMIGVSTSRGYTNSTKFISALDPQAVISSGGALVTFNGKDIFSSYIEAKATAELLEAARKIAGDPLISVDTVDSRFFTNFEYPDDALAASFGQAILTDFKGFAEDALKICFEFPDESHAKALISAFPQYDAIRFTDGYWYKFTQSGINKENAINTLCDHMGIKPSDVIAFGDDLADIGMLKLCGTGIAMGNAQPEVKAVSDLVIGSNDERGIEIFLRTIRVEYMEKLFDAASEGTATENQLDELRNYMTCGYLGDYEADEAGLFPSDLKRGVLSEDGLYDVLADEG